MEVCSGPGVRDGGDVVTAGDPVSVFACNKRLASLESIHGLRELRQLRSLNVHMNCIARIERMSPLQSLVSLVELDLSANELRTIDLGAFAALKMLKRLNLSSNRLATLSSPAGTAGGGVLRPLVSLEWLSLAFNELTSLDDLRDLQPIASLSLRSQQTTTMTTAVPTAADTPALTFLDVCGNQLSSVATFEALRRCKRLRELRVATPTLTSLGAMDDSPTAPHATPSQLPRTRASTPVRSTGTGRRGRSRPGVSTIAATPNASRSPRPPSASVAAAVHTAPDLCNLLSLFQLRENPLCRRETDYAMQLVLLLPQLMVLDGAECGFDPFARPSDAPVSGGGSDRAEVNRTLPLSVDAASGTADVAAIVDPESILSSLDASIDAGATDRDDVTDREDCWRRPTRREVQRASSTSSQESRRHHRRRHTSQGRRRARTQEGRGRREKGASLSRAEESAVVELLLQQLALVGEAARAGVETERRLRQAVTEAEERLEKKRQQHQRQVEALKSELNRRAEEHMELDRRFREAMEAQASKMALAHAAQLKAEVEAKVRAAKERLRREADNRVAGVELKAQQAAEQALEESREERRLRRELEVQCRQMHEQREGAVKAERQAQAEYFASAVAELQAQHHEQLRATHEAHNRREQEAWQWWRRLHQLAAAEAEGRYAVEWQMEVAAVALDGEFRRGLQTLWAVQWRQRERQHLEQQQELRGIIVEARRRAERLPRALSPTLVDAAVQTDEGGPAVESAVRAAADEPPPSEATPLPVDSREAALVNALERHQLEREVMAVTLATLREERDRLATAEHEAHQQLAELREHAQQLRAEKAHDAASHQLEVENLHRTVHNLKASLELRQRELADVEAEAHEKIAEKRAAIAELERRVGEVERTAADRLAKVEVAHTDALEQERKRRVEAAALYDEARGAVVSLLERLRHHHSAHIALLVAQNRRRHPGSSRGGAAEHGRGDRGGPELEGVFVALMQSADVADAPSAPGDSSAVAVALDVFLRQLRDVVAAAVSLDAEEEHQRFLHAVEAVRVLRNQLVSVDRINQKLLQQCQDVQLASARVAAQHCAETERHDRLEKWCAELEEREAERRHRQKAAWEALSQALE